MVSFNRLMPLFLLMALVCCNCNSLPSPADAETSDSDFIIQEEFPDFRISNRQLKQVEARSECEKIGAKWQLIAIDGQPLNDEVERFVRNIEFQSVWTNGHAKGRTPFENYQWLTLPPQDITFFNWDVDPVDMNIDPADWRTGGITFRKDSYWGFELDEKLHQALCHRPSTAC